jgi:hypothetical protein
MADERVFFLETCCAALESDNSIRFAGVINNQGKLLVGKYRRNIGSPLIKSNPARDPQSSSFFRAYQTLSLEKQFESDLGGLQFQLTSFKKVILLTIPLTVRNDRYLCISIDANVPSYEQVIHKIFAAIS